MSQPKITLQNSEGARLGEIHPALSRKLTRTRKAVSVSREPYVIRLLPDINPDTLCLRFV